MKVKIRQPIPVMPHKRLHDHVMDSAMGDVIDALVELITNADDSYGRLFRQKRRAKDHGQILIERVEQRGQQPSYVVVRDKAEGMTLNRMIEVLRSPGAYKSSAGDRGYMGRGAKDCAKFGDVTFESIKDGKYYRCTLTKRAMEIIPEVNGEKADSRVRKQLGLPHGNGTVVRLDIGSEFSLHRISTLSEVLRSHFALQDIIDERNNPEVLLRNGRSTDEKPEKLVSRRPDADILCEDEVFPVRGYEGVEAKISIYRASEPFEDNPSRTRAYGFLVAGKRAIHERSLLTSDIEQDPNSRRYFGRIQCDAIDRLLEEYEQRRSSGEDVTKENPRLLVDPGRRYGLERDHPFTKRLFEEPAARVRKLLEEDRKRERKERTDFGNRETRERLDRLAKAASRFLRQQVDELESLGVDEAVDEDSFVKNGVLLYPTYLNVDVGKKRTLTLYVNKAALESTDAQVVVSSDNSCLTVPSRPLALRSHRSKEDRLICTFDVIGDAEAENVVVSAKCGDLPTADALVQVVKPKIENREFSQPLEFERDEYNVYFGSQKNIKIFAQIPNVATDELEIKVASTDDTTVGVPSKCRLVPVEGTNYALAECRLIGRRLKAKATVRAWVDENEARAEVRVVEKKQEPGGPKVNIKLRDEDYGRFRAIWADHEGKPNELRVAGRHESLARYLGRSTADGKFPGEDSPLYRVLLAEVVAEAVCRKSLQLEARERPWDFNWADIKVDDRISDDVLARLQQRMREFLPIAHRAMVRESDARQDVIIGG
ncbi:MAG: hypothetical protein BMS9Abin05_2683 [Rhodothermia bacterium]|nr:MAG: hypothetical protein BMS9Abin05_2683 [Rhodothermia bacterium]